MPTLDMPTTQPQGQLQDRLMQLIPFSSIENDLQQLRYVDVSKYSEPCANRCCEWIALRQPFSETKQLSRYGSLNQDGYDNELLTSMPYLHGSLLNLPFSTLQAKLVTLAPFTACGALSAQFAAPDAAHEFLLINCQQDVYLGQADTEQQQEFAQYSLRMLPSDTTMQIINVSNQPAQLLVLLVNPEFKR